MQNSICAQTPFMLRTQHCHRNESRTTQNYRYKLGSCLSRTNVQPTNTGRESHKRVTLHRIHDLIMHARFTEKNLQGSEYLQGSHSFTGKKSRTFPGLSRTLLRNFPGPFRSPQMLKYKKTLYSQQSEYSPLQKL